MARVIHTRQVSNANPSMSLLKSGNSNIISYKLELALIYLTNRQVKRCLLSLTHRRRFVQKWNGAKMLFNIEFSFRVQNAKCNFPSKKSAWEKDPTVYPVDETGESLLGYALLLSGRCNRISFLRKPIKVSGISWETLTCMSQVLVIPILVRPV